MRFAGIVLLVVALLCGSLYLFVHNGHSVELRLAEGWVLQMPLAVQLIGALLVGALGVFTAIGVRDSGRALLQWRRGRRIRRVERSESLLAEGRRLLWRGEPERSRTLLQRAWKIRQTRDTLLTLVDACLAADNAGDARAALESARESLADDPEVLCALAAVCRRGGDRSGAIAALERARARHPRAARVLLGLRDLYLEAERWSEAAAAQAAWLALTPRVTSAAEQTTLAGTRYQAALQIPGPAARLGALEEVLNQSPRFVPAAVSLGDEMEAGGRLDEALRHWESTLRLQPRAVLVERLRAKAPDRPTRDRVRNVLRKLRLDHLDADAIHYHVAQLWLDDAVTDEAVRDLDAVGARFRERPAYRLAHARTLEQQGDLARAVDAYRAAAARPATYACGVCRRSEGEWRGRCAGCGCWDTLRSDVELIREE